MRLNIVRIGGGLGNQMFQYAFYLSLKYFFKKKDHNSIFIASYKFHNGYELDKVFYINRYLVKNFLLGFLLKLFHSFVYRKYEKSCSTYECIDIEYNKPIISYGGYWQTEKYFSKIEEKIRLTFKFDINKVNNKTKQLIKEINNVDAVSIHIRRGDYVTDPFAHEGSGGICDLAYYKRCIHYIAIYIQNPFFYIFSDDPIWANSNFAFLNNSIVVDWNKGEDSWQDMMLMSICQHNIIANSTFSWWGAWLNTNPNKIVIAPKKWFNTSDTPDIIPESWIRI